MANYTAVFERGKKKPWRKSRDQCGTCFSVSYDQLETALRKTGCLMTAEVVERFAFDDYGITVFTTGGSQAWRDRVEKLRVPWETY